MEKAPRLAVLVSGSGTILHALLDANVPVGLVVSDRPCRALGLAEEHGVTTQLLDRHAFGGFRADFERERYSDALVETLRAHDIDLVAMAGFGTVLAPAMFRAFPDRILNTHPSLLPAFKGWHAVRQALDAGVSETGCTVHVATELLDDGPVLAQARVPVLDGDTEATLHERIKHVEWELFPRVVTMVMAALERGDAVASVASTERE